MNYYSQHGEDFLIEQLFEGKTSGFFVEVGCIDGKRFSNSLAFEEIGWKGICVEAHCDYIELLKKNRPNSIICHCAVSDKDNDNVIFYANSRGTFSSLDKSTESEWKKHGKYFTGFEEQLIKQRTMNTLFKQHNVSNIDFISLDIEGHEVEAIQGLDLSLYKPKVFVIEADDADYESKLDHKLLPNGYKKSFKFAKNVFYLLDAEMERHIKEKKFEIEVVYTEHPLDDQGDKVVVKMIDLRSNGILKRFLNKFYEICEKKRKW